MSEVGTWLAEIGLGSYADLSVIPAAEADQAIPLERIKADLAGAAAARLAAPRNLFDVRDQKLVIRRHRFWGMIRGLIAHARDEAWQTELRTEHETSPYR